MRIRRLFVTNYKNLVDCEIRPTLIHAITGCNGSGKSNLLQVLPFVSKLISGADAERQGIFRGYQDSTWVPQRIVPAQLASDSDGKPASFRFELECEIAVGEIPWIVEYQLAFSPFTYLSSATPNAPRQMVPLRIESEIVSAKEVGKPGKSRTLIERGADGKTVVSYMDTRARLDFSAQDDLSVLKILEIREPKSFPVDFPVIAAFQESILATDIIRLNAPKLIAFTNPDSSAPFSRSPGGVVEHFAPFQLLKSIEREPARWAEFCAWMKILCDVEAISLLDFPVVQPPTAPDQKGGESILHFIFLSQHGRFIQPSQLSTGHAMVFGILTAMFTFLRHNGPVFLEEPESYLHPKAIVDLLKALRQLSDNTTVIVSTHSTVLLNDMRPEEVTLMKPSTAVGYFTTQQVGDIASAIATIKRGYLSIGDLLQTNFTTEEKD